MTTFTKQQCLVRENPNLTRFSAFAEYPRNAWYVAAARDEITEQPFARKLLGKPVVMYRKTDGGVVALYDSCPHRGYPLSKSRVVGDNIQCMYHGIVFNPEGDCVDMPHAPGTQISEKMCVVSYPVVEYWHWVWIWMGDPALANPDLIPKFDIADYEHYDHQFYAPLPINCNYRIMHDNLSDASHTSFLHEGLLDDPDNIEMAHAEPQIKKIGDTGICVTRVMDNFVPKEDVAGLYHLEANQRYYRQLEVWHHMPSSLTAFNRYYRYPEGSDAPNEEPEVEYCTILGLTPASENESYHFTAGSTSFKQTEVDGQSLLFVIQQDVEAFEVIQKYFEENGDEAVEVSTASDRLGIILRGIISEMLKKEKKGDIPLTQAD